MGCGFDRWASFRIMSQVHPFLTQLSKRGVWSILSVSSAQRIKVRSSEFHRGRCGVNFGRIASYTTSSDIDKAQTPKKKKRKSKKSKDEDSDGTSTSEVPKKKRKSKKKVLSDEEIKDSLIGTFIPFEGSVEEVNDSSVSFERQDLPEGRFYHCQSSTNSYSFPSVTTVLDKTRESSYPLLLWKRKLTELHGKEGFDAIRNNTLQSGINFHKELETRLSNGKLKAAGPTVKHQAKTKSARPMTAATEDVPPDAERYPAGKEGPESQDGVKEQTQVLPPQYMLSVEHVLDDIGEVKALETSIAHFSLGYVGTFDCLAEYRGMLSLIDWKTAGKLKSSLADCYDYPLQAVAYAGAINQDPRFEEKVLNVLIVIAYADGTPAHAHFVNHTLCQKYWLKWLQRLQTYQTQFSEDLSEVITN